MKSWGDIAYLVAASRVIMLFWVNTFTIITLLGYSSLLFSKSSLTIKSYIEIIIIGFILPYTLIRNILKEEDIERLEFEEDKVATGQLYLNVYIGLSIAALLISSWLL